MHLSLRNREIQLVQRPELSVIFCESVSDDDVSAPFCVSSGFIGLLPSLPSHVCKYVLKKAANLQNLL